MISEREFPGYLGTTVIAPGGNVSSVRYVINRFAVDKSKHYNTVLAVLLLQINIIYSSY